MFSKVDGGSPPFLSKIDLVSVLVTVPDRQSLNKSGITVIHRLHTFHLFRCTIRTVNMAAYYTCIIMLCRYGVWYLSLFFFYYHHHHRSLWYGWKRGIKRLTIIWKIAAKTNKIRGVLFGGEGSKGYYVTR